MHQMKQFVIDGSNVVINKTDADQQVDEFEFEMNEVFS